MSWTCPSCGQEWPEKPLIAGTIGCPVCGNVAATYLRPRESGVAEVDAVEELARNAREGIRALQDGWDALVARLSAAEQERDELRVVVREGNFVPHSALDAANLTLAELPRVQARLSAAEQALRELWRVTVENRVVSNELRAAVHAILRPRAALADRQETP